MKITKVIKFEITPPCAKRQNAMIYPAIAITVAFLIAPSACVSPLSFIHLPTA